MKDNYAVIMAGGIGSRFWPMSTPQHPKQFLDVLGIGRTLIQMTFDRLNALVPAENIYVVTNANYANLVKAQLPKLSDNQILTEPMRKNTAPCVAYAAAKIKSINPNACMIVSPADHLIMKEGRFQEIINTAIRTSIEDDSLVTLGIQPTRPDTGYGYIEFNKEEKPEAGGVVAVEQFREKPDLATAKEFVASGNFYWNSGIFVWKVDTVLGALKDFEPELYQLFAGDLSFYNTSGEQNRINQCFKDCKDISVDFAIMEHAKNVKVVLADFDWSDLGTWGSLKTHLACDEAKNSVIGQHVHMFHSSNCQVNVPSGKLVVIDGLQDYIVVESDDMLMILKGENEQELKNYLKQVEAKSPQFFPKEN